MKDSAQELLRILREHDGRLPLNDDSSPEEIARTVQMSKKVFKRSLGMLLRSGEVTLTEGGIETNAGHGED